MSMTSPAPTIYDVHALKLFVAVCKTGSMTTASKQLGLTQSAVSQAIRQIEDLLGAVLIDRSERPLRPTAAGRVLQQHAAAIVDEVESLPSVIRQTASTSVPKIRVGLIDSFASTAGPALIRTLLSNKVRCIAARSGIARDHADALLSRNLDLIVTGDPLDDVDGLDRYLLLSEPFVLLLPEELAKSMRRPDLGTLAARYSLIRFSARSQIGIQVDRQLRRLGIKAPRLLELDPTDAVVAMVSGGVGWAIATPLCLLQVRSQIAGVRVLPFPGAPFVRHLYLVARSGEYDELASNVAHLARDVARKVCVPAIRSLVPWVSDQIIVHPV